MLTTPTYQQQQQQAKPELSHRNILKKGWLYKRGTFNCFSRWKTKYAVLYELPQPVLYIYDQRNHQEPKYIIRIQNIRMKVGQEIDVGLQFNRKDFEILVETRNRKFLFAAQSKTELQDWMNLLHHYSLPMAQQEYLRETPYKMEDDQKSVYSAYSFKRSDSRMSLSSIGSAQSRPRSRSRSRQSNRTGESISGGYKPEPAIPLDNCPDLKLDDTIFLSSLEIREFIQAPAQKIQQQSQQQDPLRNWDSLYQSQLQKMTSKKTTEEVLKLDELIGEFHELSCHYTKKIIDQIHLRGGHKELGPNFVPVSGSAEDDEFCGTFMYGNILFSFAADYFEENEEEILKYEKKAAHEIRTINAFLAGNGLGLSTALMTVTDYKGFRMVAYPVMPLDPEKTLVYCAEMKIAPRNQIALNVQQHLKQFCQSEFHISGENESLEIHQTPQNHFYLLNISETFPVDNFPVAVRQDPSIYKLRPEFLKHFPQQIQNSSSFIRNELVPRFVAKLENLEIECFDSLTFIKELHSFGLNVRYLGLIYEQTKIPAIKQFCFIQLLARASKFLLRQSLRQAILNAYQISALNPHSQLMTLTLDFFNTILGSFEQQKRIWNEKLKEVVYSKFGIKLEYETIKSFWYRPRCFIELQKECGVRFAVGCDYDFAKPLSPVDFKSFVIQSKTVDPKVKINHKTDYEKYLFDFARVFLKQGPLLKWHKNEQYGSVLIPVLNELLLNKQYVTCQVLSAFSSQFLTLNSFYFYMTYLSLLESHLYQSNASVQQVNELSQQLDWLEKVVEWTRGRNDVGWVRVWEKMVYLWNRLGDIERSHDVLEKLMTFCESSFGSHHSVTTSYWMKKGYLLMQKHQYKPATLLFQQSLHFYMQQNETNSISECLYSLSECFMELNDIKTALAFSQRCLSLRESYYGMEHAKTMDAVQLYSKLKSTNCQGPVLTKEMEKDLSDALEGYERVFVYLRKQKGDGKELVLLSLARTMIELKLKLLPQSMKSTMVRLRNNSGVYNRQDLKQVMMKLISLSPNLYLEQLYQSGVGKVGKAQEEVCKEILMVERICTEKELLLGQ